MDSDITQQSWRNAVILDSKTNTAKVAISAKDQREIMELYERLREVQAKLVGPDGKAEILPNNVYSFLCRLLADLKAGNSVTLLQNKAELTTVESAKLLGMSRQFLVNLLGRGELPFHMIGTHRRLYARDVLAYKSRRDSSRRTILDDLSRAEHEDGIYDRLPER